MFPLLKHGFDEDMQLVGALVLGLVDPPVVPLAALQACQDHLLGLVNGGHSWWRIGRTSAEAWTSTWTSTLACRLKQFSQMLWLVFSLEFALSFLVVFFPPPLCGFLFLPSLKQYFLKCPLIQQLHTKSLAGQSFLSLCRLLPQLLQQSVGTTTLFWSFLFMVTPVTTCWLVSRIPCEDLGGLTGHCL